VGRVTKLVWETRFVTRRERELLARHERWVTQLAARRHGCVTTAQLRHAGFAKEAIAHRVDTGWLTRLHRGVYRLGPLEDPLTRVMAALFACGERSALSDLTALAMWRILGELPEIVDISVPCNRRERHGVRIHRRRTMPALTVLDGCRITTPAATIADTAPRLSERDLARAIEQTQILRLATHAELAALLPGRRSRALQHQPRLTRSEAERRLLELIDKAGLPRPITNVRVGRHEVDLYWPAQRLVVEVDGYAFHANRHAFERDRARDADLIARGERVARVTFRQIVGEPEAVIARLAAALAA
jgi:very-short-patch-repair endonuclease